MPADRGGGTGLQRSLGLASLTFYGIGLIIGAGIYSVIGAVAGKAGNGLWLSFVVAAVAAFLTALSYAELATMFPKAGAEYVYLQHAAPRGRWIPFLMGVVLTVAATATATSVALAFGGYLGIFIPVPPIAGALLLLVVATGVSLIGIRESSWINTTFTLVEMGGLVMIIVLGMPSARAASLAEIPAFGATLGAASLVFFVYLGFEGIANLAEEARRPERDLPRAILLSLAVTTVLYVAVSVAAVSLVSPARLAASTSPMADAVSVVSGRAGNAIGVIALFATGNTALITLIAASRKLFSMAAGGDMPPFLGRTFGRRGTPSWASFAVLGGAVLLLPLGSVAEAASLSSLASLVAFLAVNLALIVLRYRDADRPRPFRVPLAIGRLPILPVAGMGIAGLLALQFDGRVYLAGILVLVLGWAVYGLRLRFGPPPEGTVG